MKKFRRYNIVLAFILGGILTPPDVFSQIALASILICLFELGLLLLKFCTK
jgi:sec-independent protein translocase protein TatC